MMQTFQTPKPIAVEVHVGAGSVHLIAGARDDTSVTVNSRVATERADVEAAERINVGLVGRKLVVDNQKRGIGGLVGLTRSGSVDVTIELPEDSSLEVTTGMGDVNADGLFGDVVIKSGAGAIHVDRAATVHLRTGEGNLSLGQCRGSARVTTAGEMSIGRIGGEADIENLNGTTRIDEVAGRISVVSANGDIRVGRAGSNVSARTANGRIVIGEVGGGDVSLESAAGGLEAGIADGVVAWVDVSTKFGQVHNSLEPTGTPDDVADRVVIRARTSFGDIRIHRSSIDRQDGQK